MKYRLVCVKCQANLCGFAKIVNGGKLHVRFITKMLRKIYLIVAIPCVQTQHRVAGVIGGLARVITFAGGAMWSRERGESC